MQGTLRVTPEQLLTTAAEFNACGTTIRNITASMTDIVTGLSSAWAGDDANAYVAKFNGLQDDVEKMHAIIQEHATDLSDMARNYNAAKSEVDTTIQSLPTDVIV